MADRRLTAPLNELAILAIRCYQRVSEEREHTCLHHPTCSDYGRLAYERYDFLTATSKTVERLMECHPFSTLPYEDYP